jgi:hypothetical protein
MRLGGISTGSNLGTREIARGKLRKRNQHVACMEHSINENYWYCFVASRNPWHPHNCNTLQRIINSSLSPTTLYSDWITELSLACKWLQPALEEINLEFSPASHSPQQFQNLIDRSNNPSILQPPYSIIYAMKFADSVTSSLSPPRSDNMRHSTSSSNAQSESPVSATTDLHSLGTKDKHPGSTFRR